MINLAAIDPRYIAMSATLPFDQLWFQRSLSETIAWCLGQSLENDPAESPEILERRRLGQEAAKLLGLAFRKSPENYLKTAEYNKPTRLYAKARVGEIAPPLHSQLRSELLRPAPFVVKQSDGERLAIVNGMVLKRAEALRERKKYPAPMEVDLEGGK